MFQQFKNIFPNASLNIRSITESVGINNTEWNRGVERLDALRNEFQNLNSIFSNRQDYSDTLSSQHSASNKEEASLSIRNLKATGRMIDKLQEGWDGIHKSNLDNFEKAQVADIKLRQLKRAGELHYKVCETMEHVEDNITEIHSDLKTIQASAANLMHVLEKLEEQIDQVSVDYEKQQFELWKQEQEKALMDEMSNRRQLLREKEAKLKQQYEEYDNIQQKKRVELYEANFNAELEDYRRRRETEVSSLYSHQSNATADSTASLDQVKLQETGEDLDQFLGDTTERTPLTLEKQLQTKKTKKETSKTKVISQSVYSSSDEDDSKIEILADEDYEDL
ncbi:uncharacterized protein ATC70_002172 [Mucor velutinosus]|uniref:Uncharacterized protein n=1 Tax=Mucor velutinosus TaxID=708070 RepID=A0AAN7DDK6_9FUNG|nr:hypothetical protein ATC70_002172 [Mucor velutinosus]